MEEEAGLMREYWASRVDPALRVVMGKETQYFVMEMMPTNPEAEVLEFFGWRQERDKITDVAWMNRAEAMEAGCRSEDMEVWDECLSEQ